MNSGRKRIIIARKLRRNSTETEKYLWKHLRRKLIEGSKFRRQQPIGKYIVDFVDFEKKIVIEVDGGQHALYKEKDEIRDKWLNEQGFEVLRFWDNEILRNVEGVIEIIRAKMSPLPTSPTRGEVKKDKNS